MKITSNLLQTVYNALYIELRKYIWDLTTVEALVDLEQGVYTALPDLKFIEACLARLKQDASVVMAQDDDLRDAFTDFEDILVDVDDVYAKLTIV